jgi:hypothetical protein
MHSVRRTIGYLAASLLLTTCGFTESPPIGERAEFISVAEQPPYSLKNFKTYGREERIQLVEDSIADANSEFGQLIGMKAPDQGMVARIAELPDMTTSEDNRTPYRLLVFGTADDVQHVIASTEFSDVTRDEVLAQTGDYLGNMAGVVSRRARAWARQHAPRIGTDGGDLVQAFGEVTMQLRREPAETLEFDENAGVFRPGYRVALRIGLTSEAGRTYE